MYQHMSRDKLLYMFEKEYMYIHRADIYEYTHASRHSYVDMYMNILMYIHVYMARSIEMRTYLQARVHVNMNVCVYMWGMACTYACLFPMHVHQCQIVIASPGIFRSEGYDVGMYN